MIGECVIFTAEMVKVFLEGLDLLLQFLPLKVKLLWRGCLFELLEKLNEIVNGEMWFWF